MKEKPENSLCFDFRVLIVVYVYIEKFGQEFRISDTYLSFLGNVQELTVGWTSLQNVFFQKVFDTIRF